MALRKQGRRGSEPIDPDRIPTTGDPFLDAEYRVNVLSKLVTPKMRKAIVEIHQGKTWAQAAEIAGYSHADGASNAVRQSQNGKDYLMALQDLAQLQVGMTVRERLHLVADTARDTLSRDSDRYDANAGLRAIELLSKMCGDTHLTPAVTGTNTPQEIIITIDLGLSSVHARIPTVIEHD